MIACLLNIKYHIAANLLSIVPLHKNCVGSNIEKLNVKCMQKVFKWSFVTVLILQSCYYYIMLFIISHLPRRILFA